MYCQSINQTLRIIWVKCTPLNLRLKTRRRATPLLPTWIYSCRLGVTVSCALPFTTNVTISTAISQTIRSLVAIFHLRQPMVFLSAKSRKYQGVFEVKSRVKTWQVRGIWSQQLEHKQVSQWGTEPGVRKGKRSLLACHTRCKCSIETAHNR